MATIALDRPRSVAERAPFLEGLFLATVFSVTFAKLQWEVAGTLSLSDVVTGLFLLAFVIYRAERFDGRLERAALITLAFFVAFLLVYLIGWFNLETTQSLAQWAKGMVKFLLHFLFLVAGISLIARRGVQFYWLTLGAFVGGVTANAAYGVAQLAVAEGTGRNLDAGWLQPLTGGASKINIYGAIEGQNVFRINALTGDPNHLGIELAAVLVLMLPIYLRLEQGHRYRTPLAVLLGFLLVVELATLSRSGMLGLGCGFLVLLIPYRRHFLTARFLVPLAVVMAGLLVFLARRAAFFEQVLTSRLSTEGRGSSTHFLVYDFIPDVLAQHPLFGLGLNTFSVYYEFQTGKTNFGPHSFYVASFVETGLVGTLVFAAFLVYLFRRAGATRHIGRALAAIGDPLAARVWPLGWGLTAALVVDDGVERLLPDDVVLLLLRHRPARDRRAGGVRTAPERDVKVVVLTTSYPRDAGDVAGTFVRDGVEALRDAGVEVRVVSPASFRHYGIAYGDGIVNNLRRAPWKALALPLFFLSFARAARRAARGADVVHAHWLPSALPALATGKPFVLQLWGSDVALRAPHRPARAAHGPARRDRRLRVDGARRGCARPWAPATSGSSRAGSRFPTAVAEPDEPPHALYVGRLSEEKGVRELAEATRDSRSSSSATARSVRSSRRPSASSRRASSGPGTSARQSWSSRRGARAYGMVAREAMAHGRPVVGDRRSAASSTRSRTA